MYVRLAVVLYHVCTMLNGCRFQLLWEALGLPNGPCGVSRENACRRAKSDAARMYLKQELVHCV